MPNAPMNGTSGGAPTANKGSTSQIVKQGQTAGDYGNDPFYETVQSKGRDYKDLKTP